MPLPPVPNIVILGFEDNASRWLRFNLDRHPDIYLPPINTGFFADADRMARIGHKWYREQFHGWAGERFLGELSLDYVTFTNQPTVIADRLRRHVPDAKYLLVLDEPVDRFCAVARRYVRRGRLPAGLDLDAFCRFQVEPEIGLQTVADGIMSPGVGAVVDRFGDDVLALFVDEMRADPEAAYRAAVAHIGADPSFVPEGLTDLRYDDDHIVHLADPSLEGRRHVYTWYRIDVANLEESLGVDLSRWDPGTGDEPSSEDLLEMMVAAWKASTPP